jgi:signal transduction histidine kinase
MKHLFLITCFFITASSFGQEVFQLQRVNQGEIILDKGWKFHAGDDLSWAKPDYDDSNWEKIDPTEELHHLPQVKKAGIGWFRLTMQIDSSLADERLTMVTSVLGAAEIYLNGELIYSFGTVSSEYKKEITRFFTNHLFSFKLGPQRIQKIAVRYSFNKKNFYLKFTNARPIIRLKLRESNAALADHIREDEFDSKLRSIQSSFYLPLGFLLLFLFLSFRLQKEYLYSGVFCFCLFMAIILHITALSEPTTVSRTDYLLLATQVFYIIGSFALINGTYILYKQKKSWFYYIIILYGLFIIPFFFISYDASGLFNACFFPLIDLEFLRLNILAVRRRRPGAWILLITSLLFAIVIISYIVAGGKGDLGSFLASLSYFILGIGLSLFYAGEFARTASSLQQSLTEVKELSEEMIATEKEKQQILSAQNETLEKQVSERTAALSQSLKELKETQAQLIQREKMASLGELTAGIAHEIQNPLNFINNFSEVNKELLQEMKEEIDSGNTQVVKTIADDVIYNQEKINEHGKRADAIVKGMLQHSGNSSGVKEPTDINKLADEYSRLSHHGFRAKDKSFNATLKTDFDVKIGNINIIPQDIGRVILNLINNAFYAADEKRKQNLNGYEPTVSVSTKKVNGKVEVSVKDNGNGIPQKVLDKIFQPFFTTKPTGQGTGLGLSLSYDIVKAHGGELKVETKEGEGSEFIIQLPD